MPVKIQDRMLLAALVPCAKNTVDKLVRGGRVIPAIEHRIRQVAAEQKIALPAPRKAGL
jgi:hypothetical protein